MGSGRPIVTIKTGPHPESTVVFGPDGKQITGVRAFRVSGETNGMTTIELEVYALEFDGDGLLDLTHLTCQVCRESVPHQCPMGT